MFDSYLNFETWHFRAFHLKQEVEIGLPSYPRGHPLSHIPNPHPHNRWGMGGVSDFIHACERKLSIYSNNEWGVRYGRTSASRGSLSSYPFSLKIGGVSA